ncbi:MAG: site-specific integrase [Bacillus sp. (in: Bacteria)]|nr:site-specific integrase [Bacillus sp. (in: firmicutes)]
MQNVNFTHIEELLEVVTDKGLAKGTIRKIYNLVNTSLKDAVIKDYIIKNPVEKITAVPKASKEKIDYWTKEEVKKFFSQLEKIDHRQHALFVLAIYCGMRRGELLGLKWSDMDFENNRIGIRQILAFKSKIKDGAKTNAGNRSIKMSPFVASELEKHKEQQEEEKRKAREYFDNGLVFCQEDGQPVSWGNFHKFWVRIIEKTKVRAIRFHDLRHTCASLLLSANVHPKKVQELLGHASIKVTLDTYSHLIPSMQDEVADKMDELLK